MAKETKTEPSPQPSNALEMKMKYYPPRVFTYLVLAGVTSAFLFLSIGYFLTTFGTGFNNFKLPLIFHANTVIILVSSYAMNQTRKAAYRDDMDNYLFGLLTTAGLGIAFTVFQFIGWSELQRNGIDLRSNIAGTYLYFISGLHLLHLLVGVVFLGGFALRAFNLKRDAVEELLFESNPFDKLKVDLLCTYWHFVDGLWIYLYLFFLLNLYVLA